ncbi:hypothetical protein ADL26_16735, partial [Thermoactinomyces vulgaris]
TMESGANGGTSPAGRTDNGGDGMRRSTSQRGRHLAPEAAAKTKTEAPVPHQPEPPVDDDLPLAREAQRAVRVLNPSGSVTMPRPPR